MLTKIALRCWEEKANSDTEEEHWKNYDVCWTCTDVKGVQFLIDVYWQNREEQRSQKVGVDVDLDKFQLCSIWLGYQYTYLYHYANS